MRPTAMARTFDPALRGRTGAVRSLNGEVAISKEQRNVHVTTEAFAVAVAAPFSLWLALSPAVALPTWARYLSGFIGVGTLVVDGGLLLSYLRKEK